MNFTPDELVQILFAFFILGSWISYLIFERRG
jgi:hypothetical protein